MLDHGTYHHDGAAARRDHGGHAGLGQLHGAEKIDVHGTAPAVEVGLRDRFEIARVVGAVEQHVDAPATLQGAGRQRLALGPVGDISGHFHHLRRQPQGEDIRLDRIQVGLGAGGQHHRRGAFASRQHRQFLSQAGAYARHDDHLVL